MYAQALGAGIEPARVLGLDFGGGGIQAILWAMCLLGVGLLWWLSDAFTLVDVALWAAVTLGIVVLVSVDLAGCTPVLERGLTPDRRLAISLDADACTGCGTCTRVCPRDCFRLELGAATVAVPHPARCVQCGACIVQCPVDALSFRTPDGGTVSAATVRHGKLDLMGRRR